MKDVEFKTTLMYPLNLLPGAIPELLATVKDTHYITQADRYGMMAAILDESLSDEDRFSLDRLLRSVSRGRVQILDELSIIL